MLTKLGMRATPPRRLANLLLTSAILSAVALPCHAGDEAPQAEFTEELGVGLVLVPVVVRSPSGYVRNLTAKDFQLFVDDKPVPIESFENRSDAPLSTVFLQDLSGSMDGQKLEASREAVRYFLSQATPIDEFAIATFADGKTTVDVPFTSELGPVEESLATWEAFGVTTLNDAVAWLPEISAGGTHTKRAAVLITDGADNASNLTPDQARTVVKSAQVPVYVLGLGAGSPYETSIDGKKLARFADVLNLLALYTGGRYFPVEGPNQLKEAVVDMVDDLRHQYVLSFSTSGSGKSKARTLRVEVKSSRYRVLSRQGYTGTAPVALGRS